MPAHARVPEPRLHRLAIASVQPHITPVLQRQRLQTPVAMSQPRAGAQRRQQREGDHRLQPRHQNRSQRTNKKGHV